MSGEKRLSRDVVATQIPAGSKQTLPAGSRIFIHQRLGGSFTVQTDYGLFRVEGPDADALGERPAPSSADSSAVASAKAEAPRNGPKEGPSSSAPPDTEALWAQLRQVFDPEIPVNIVDLGLVYSLDVAPLPDNGGYRVDVMMTLTAPGCGMGPAIAEDAKTKILLVPGVSEADVRLTWDPPWNQEMISEEGKMKLGLV